MPKPLRMVVLIIAAGIGAFMLRQLYVAASTPAAPSVATEVRVRVAAADLPEGLLLRDNDLAWKPVPRAQVPAGAFVESQPGADLKGALLRNRVDAGAPIRADNVIPAGAPDFLAAALQPGMRAISVPVDDVSGNAGLIQPGDFVDVVLTQQIGGSATTPGTFEAETVVRRARVLAVGSEFQRAKAPASAPDAPVRARTVTLEVAPRTAQVVLVATRLGSLSLALRSFATRDRREAAGGNEAEPDTPPVWAGEVSRAFRDAPRSPAARSEAGTRSAPQGNAVVIYRGSSVDDGSHGAGSGAGMPGVPPLPAGWPGTPVAPAAPRAAMPSRMRRRRCRGQRWRSDEVTIRGWPPGGRHLTGTRMVRMVRWIAFWWLACIVAPGFAFAQRAPAADAGTALSIATGKGEMLTLSEPATAMFVADPSIADIQVPSSRTVFVFGKKAGTTTLIALGANHRPILRRTVIVQVDTASLQAVLDSRFPQLKLSVSGAPGSLMVSGKVPSAADADAVMQSLGPYLNDKEKIVNRLTLSRPIQVNLRVRVTEVSRNVTQQLGINWSSLGAAGNFIGGLFNGRTLFDPTNKLFNLSPTGAYSVVGGFHTGRWSIDVVLDALDQEGLITMLAEPNLTAMSGQTASFLAGGEIPIPVAQAGNTTGAITVEYKPFGVSLDFTPTVLADNRISLKVRPEVSEVDPSNSVTTGSITVPGLSVRRVETTVELSSGQSFAIGGLLQSQTADTVSQIPGLGRLPIIGRLFSSKNFQDHKTEVVVIVTPYIVQPTGPGQLEQALDTVARPSSDLEFAIQRNLGIDLLTGDTPRLVGAAGFVY